MLFTYALFLLYAGFSGETFQGSQDLSGPFIWAGDALAHAWPYALVAAGVWFAIAYAFYQGIIDVSTGARLIQRTDDPRLYRLLENLCISRGITTPKLRVIETPALNAYATGLHEGQYSITVTRGLIAALTEDELEAVLAHELTHIRNRDVRLLIISVIFVGIFSFIGEMVFRSLRFGGGSSSGGGSRRSSDRSSGGGAALAIIVALLLMAIAYALAVVIRFALSRRREYLADAGAVELTKNPDAMISALQKISGRAAIPGAPSEVREMFIENAHAEFAGLFATHPPIEKRIAALMEYAGGRKAEPTGKGPWV
ncbi:MAG: M48 family metalloprotease [Alphaproteobacteria bacterium]|nr:M48 family metalloprotease [Alphaproteobacteria bacterium]